MAARSTSGSDRSPASPEPRRRWIATEVVRLTLEVGAAKLATEPRLETSDTQEDVPLRSHRVPEFVAHVEVLVNDAPILHEHPRFDAAVVTEQL